MQKIPKAFSLLELLITLGIAALLVSLAMPGLGSAMQAQTGAALINDLARTFNQARAAAVTSGAIVTLCRSSDGATCTGQWNQGMLLFTDSNGDRQINGDDQVLRIVRPSTSGSAGTIALRSFPNRQYVQFTPPGFTKQNGSFTWCPADLTAAHAQQLIFTQSGRARIARDHDGDGLREDASGNALVCL